MLYLNEGYTGTKENPIVRQLDNELNKSLKTIFNDFYNKCKENNVCLDTFSYLCTSNAFSASTEIIIDNGYNELRAIAIHQANNRIKEV